MAKEYKVEEIKENNAASIEVQLNVRGQEGWKFKAIQGSNLFFSRKVKKED